MPYLEYIIPLSPVFVLIIFREIKLHVSIAKMQTDISWIKKELNQCRPTLEDDTL